MIRNHIIALLGAAFFALSGLGIPSAKAQEGLGALVRIEVLDGGLTSRGTQRAALRLILADGWKTYWRAPGDAGIPPRFNWSGSSNVRDVSVSWPTPDVFYLSGFRSFGYEKELVLPVEITTRQPGQPVRLMGDIEFGVCKEVCVPARLTFDQALSPNAGRNAIISGALARQPFSAEEAGVTSVTCRISPAKDGGLLIQTMVDMPSAGGTEIAVIEPGNPELWTSETESSRSGNVLTTTGEVVNLSGAAFALDRSRIRITVLGERHAVDIVGCAPA